MSNQIIKSDNKAVAFEEALIQGNLANLNTEQRLSYYKSLCESLGLNPQTKPFEYISMNGKLVLYAKRDCTDQLRKIHNVSIHIVDRKIESGILSVTAQASMADGRKDESIGAVVVEHLKGDNLANAIMKAETKAKRRVTLSICGLGMLDESELHTVPGVRHEPHLNPIVNVKPKPEAPPMIPPHNPSNETIEFAPHKPIIDDYEQKEREAIQKEAVIESKKATAVAKYTIPSGSLKGTKLSDKPESFWVDYATTLKLKLDMTDFPANLRKEAEEIYSHIMEYLGD